MMSPLWLLPGLIMLVGGAAIVALLRSVAEEARLLAGELGRQREVADALRGVGRDLQGIAGPSGPLSGQRSPLRSRR